ncbi:polysaccharide deacetylase family protein [Streptomyces sp. CA-111067]|uniref:polysaccharide deacetylase family protein n=1 Tax=Streptomyces sp. CA-111067 TaxID=3240046 RepID=UPI003D96A4BD
MQRSLRRPAVAMAVVTALGVGAAVVQTAAATTQAGAADASCTGYVALTFDDGPTPGNTTTLLNTLKTAGVRATMFNTGQNVQANPDLARAEVAAGMWIGNHSWDHPYMTQLSTQEQTSQISRTQDVIKQVTGVTPQLFRPPYIDTNDALRAVERQFGLTEINADVDSQDWNNATVDQIVANAGQLQSGGVILMHDWPANTLQAVPRIVTNLHARGLCAGMISPATGHAVAPDGTTTPPTGGSTATCTAAYRTTSNWTGGFQGEVTVTNSGTTTVNSWKATLNLAAGVTISSIWNGVNTGSTGTVTVSNSAYNGTLSAGQSATVGFTGTGDPAGTTALCPGSPTDPTTPPTDPTPPASGVLAQVNTAGRVTDQGSTVKYTWPGVYFEGRFHGTSVGIVLNDASNDYEVQIDGGTATALLAPGDVTHWVTGLTDADHSVRVAKRTESPWSAGQFGGFVAGTGGTMLSKPAARTKQIEFIGDSWTAGYGDMSTSHDCSAAGVNRNSNANQSFGALTARNLDADYQINAWSGMGMVRNYNGGNAGTNYRTYYDTALQAVDSSAWQRPDSWKPQYVVVGLGINDFSTALNPGEPWANEAALVADYRAAYQAFIDKLRARYGANTYIVLTYPYLYNTNDLADSITQIVKQRNDQGDARVRSFYYDNSALGLDLLGCDWHPSQQDHKKIATALTSFLNSLS